MRKTLIASLAALLALAGLLGCAYVPVRVRMNPNPLGLAVSGHRILVKNASCARCAVVVYDTLVGALPPGTEFVHERYWEALDPEVPVMAVCFGNDPEMPLFVKGHVFRVQREHPEANAWTIQAPPEAHVPREGAACLAGDPAARRAKFPREGMNGTLWLQAANETPFPAKILVSGRAHGTLAPGQVWTYRAKLTAVGEKSAEIVVQMIFVHEGAFVGEWQRDFRIYSSQAAADQIFLKRGNVRWSGEEPIR